MLLSSKESSGTADFTINLIAVASAWLPKHLRELSTLLEQGPVEVGWQ